MPDEQITPREEMILLLDPYARAGRTGHRLRVADAKRLRAQARDWLGTSRENTPTAQQITLAALELSKLLNDATEGDARIMVRLGKGDDAEYATPADVLRSFQGKDR